MFSLKLTHGRSVILKTHNDDEYLLIQSIEVEILPVKNTTDIKDSYRTTIFRSEVIDQLHSVH